MLPTLEYSKIDELDAITITASNYRATVLLQGAQLIHFSTQYEPDNWLWVSEFDLTVPILTNYLKELTCYRL